MGLPFASRIIGTGSAFPKRILTNDELTLMLAKKGIETSDAWIQERTGIKQRHITERGNPAEHNSSLGAAAAKRALEMAGKRPEDIDQILYATCTPDMLIPCTACSLQEKIGAKNAWAIDLNAACSGFVFGLSVADQFIKSGQVKTALVIGADVLSPFVNWDDRTSCILFGDAAGAAVIERTSSDDPSRILSSHLQTDGTLHDLFDMIAGGSNMEVTVDAIDQKLNKMRMKGKEVFKHAVRTLSDFAVKALQANGVRAGEVDWFIPHQANMRIIEAVAKRLEIPMNKVLLNIERCGNTSSGTVPTVMDEAVRDGRIKKGQLILVDVFGAGLTYGSVLLRW